MKRTILISLLALFGVLPVSAQTGGLYSVGVRAGFLVGATADMKMTERQRLSFTAGERWQGVQFLSTYQWHNPLFENSSADWNWYYGAGAHAGFHGYYNRFLDNESREPDTYMTVGLDAIIGLECHIESMDLIFSVDWKPHANFSGYYPVAWDGGGFGVRYVLE